MSVRKRGTPRKHGSKVAAALNARRFKKPEKTEKTLITARQFSIVETSNQLGG